MKVICVNGVWSKLPGYVPTKIEFANGSVISTPDDMVAAMVTTICGDFKIAIGTHIPDDDYEIGQGKPMTQLERDGRLVELSFAA